MKNTDKKVKYISGEMETLSTMDFIFNDFDEQILWKTQNVTQEETDNLKNPISIK